jgi:nitrogen fixation protein NifX
VVIGFDRRILVHEPPEEIMDRTHLRLAMTTNSLIEVDATFNAARQMVIYDVGADWSEFVDVVPLARGGRKGPGGGPTEGGCWMDEIEDVQPGDDPLADRVAAVDGCSVLFTCGLSDLAAMRVFELAVFPVKTERVRAIDEVIASVQTMLGGRPPLWMRRLLRDSSGARLPARPEEQVE